MGKGLLEERLSVESKTPLCSLNKTTELIEEAGYLHFVPTEMRVVIINSRVLLIDVLNM